MATASPSSVVAARELSPSPRLHAHRAPAIAQWAAVRPMPAGRLPGATITCRCGTALLAAALVFTSGFPESPPPPPSTYDILSNIPQTLSGDDGRAARIKHPKSRTAEKCVGKCVTTCIRGGGGSPGEGPLNVRRPLVVFKSGFRSRQYCLIECSDICNLIRDGDDGP